MELERHKFIQYVTEKQKEEYRFCSICPVCKQFLQQKHSEMPNSHKARFEVASTKMFDTGKGV